MSFSSPDEKHLTVRPRESISPSDEVQNISRAPDLRATATAETSTRSKSVPEKSMKGARDILDQLNSIKERCPSLSKEASSSKPHDIVNSRRQRFKSMSSIAIPQTPSAEFELAYRAFKKENYWKALYYCERECSCYFTRFLESNPIGKPSEYQYKHNILPEAVVYWKACMLRGIILLFGMAKSLFSETIHGLYTTSLHEVLERILGGDSPNPAVVNNKHDLSILESREFLDAVVHEEITRIKHLGSSKTLNRKGFVEASKKLDQWRNEYIRRDLL
ncbi:MAG: hypothetical protein Q9220_001819 [cf. Caloplaca sp. 1 TL-2023]